MAPRRSHPHHRTTATAGRRGIVSEAFFRGQKPFGFNNLEKNLGNEPNFFPWGSLIGFCWSETIDSKRFLKKSQERTQFLPHPPPSGGHHPPPDLPPSRGEETRRRRLSSLPPCGGGLGWGVASTREGSIHRAPILRPRPVNHPHAGQREARVEACAGGTIARDLFPTASSNPLQSVETSAPAQILFECEIAARRRPEPARRVLHTTRNPKSQYFPIQQDQNQCPEAAHA